MRKDVISITIPANNPVARGTLQKILRDTQIDLKDFAIAALEPKTKCFNKNRHRAKLLKHNAVYCVFRARML